jgi:hypothetical protein
MTIDDIDNEGTYSEADTVFHSPESSQLVASVWAGPSAHLQRRREPQRQGRRRTRSVDFCLALR